MDSLHAPDDEVNNAIPPATEAPRHGFRGHAQTGPALGIPASLSIAISREAGARGGRIAHSVGAKLGWEVYKQELLEYITQEASVRQDLIQQLTPAAQQWIEDQLQQLLRQHQNLGANPSILELVRTILALGVQGDVVLLGRGAGCILPSRSTLHVRLLAPLADRVAFVAQSLRLTEEEAAKVVAKRDAGRAEFLTTQFRRRPIDAQHYDLLLNSSFLGEECCTDLICQAAQAKKLALAPPGDAPAQKCDA